MSLCFFWGTYADLKQVSKNWICSYRFPVKMQKPVKQPPHSYEWSVSSLVFVTCHTVQVLHSFIKRSGFKPVVEMMVHLGGFLYLYAKLLDHLLNT